MNIWVINGPNLNLLGHREPQLYGQETYGQLISLLHNYAGEKGLNIICLQSNHEGDLVEYIQRARGQAHGLVLNPGAYTHTSIALLDALLAVGLPAVEVHISPVEQREEFRRQSFIRPACLGVISGQGLAGYVQAIELLLAQISDQA